MAPLTGPAPAAPPSEHGIDRRQVLLILATRWRILLRAASESWWRLLLTVVALLCAAVLLAGLAVGAFFGTRFLRADPAWSSAAPDLLHLATLVLFLWLALSPALGLRGSEFLDVTKLFTLPVSHRTVFAASLLGLATSWTVLFLTVPLLAAVAGWGGPPLEVAGGLLAVLLVALTGIAVGQTLLLLFLDVFRSRRWRDVSRLLVALLGAGIYVASRLLSQHVTAGGARAALDAFGRWRDWTMPLPSWWGAHAVAGTSPARWLPALALPAALVVLVRAAARLQERTYFGEVQERRVGATESGRGLAAWWGRRLPGALGALVEKDLRVVTRDPSVRLALIQQSAYSVLPLAYGAWQLVSETQGRAHVHAATGALVYVPVIAAMQIVLNPLGTDGAGIQHTLLTAVPRRTVLAAKVVAFCVIPGAGIALLAGAGGFVAGRFVDGGDAGTGLLVGALGMLEALAAFAVTAGIGAVVGAALPYRAVTRDRRALGQASKSGTGGCLRGAVYVAAILATVVACAPLVLAFHHPAMFGAAGVESTRWLLLTVPVAIAYAALLAWAGVRAGGGLLERREEQVVAELTRSAQ